MPQHLVLIMYAVMPKLLGLVGPENRIHGVIQAPQSVKGFLQPAKHSDSAKAGTVERVCGRSVKSVRRRLQWKSIRHF